MGVLAGEGGLGATKRPPSVSAATASELGPSAETHRVCGELGGVVVDVSDPDEGGGRVGQAVGGVSLHVSGLDDQGILGDFLKAEKKRKNAQGMGGRGFKKPNKRQRQRSVEAGRGGETLDS